MLKTCINCKKDFEINKFYSTGKNYRFNNCGKCRYQKNKNAYIRYSQKLKDKKDKEDMHMKIKICEKEPIKYNIIDDNDYLIDEIMKIINDHKNINFNDYFDYNFYLNQGTTNENLNNLYDELKFWCSRL